MTGRKKKITAAVLLIAAAAAAVILAWNPLLRLYRQMRHLPDENGMYQIGEQWFEEMPDLNEKSILNFASKLNKIQADILTDENRAFYAVIPDKSWYEREEGYKTVDQEKLLSLIRENIAEDFTEIDLTAVLNTGNYYETDRHWRQETLEPVVGALASAMDFEPVRLDSFTLNEHSPFIGSYFKYLPKNWKCEPFYYLTNSFTENAQVENMQFPDFHEVYDTARLESENTYDVYLSGVSPMITITNPDVKNGRELVIFRDSFSSSLTPLLLSEYETVTLVDLRFMFSSKLADAMEFTDQDVLFLYSTWIVNNSSMLR